MEERITTAGSRWKIPSEGSVWLWLNHQGEGLVWGRKDRFILRPGMYALTGGGEPADWVGVRYPGGHQLDLLVIDPSWLASRLNHELLHPEMRAWLANGCPVAFCGLMGVWERDLARALGEATTLPGLLVAEAKILEWAAVRLFRSADPSHPAAFCARFGRPDPVRRALDGLRSRIGEPLDLKRLARESGIAPHHLSRCVRRETGATLQQHLRRLRVEHACDLLAAGRMNVTEAALEVGYQSLSHFAKAFRQELGVTPRDWLAARKRTG